MRHEIIKSREEIMKRIRAGELSMRPRWRFAAAALLAAASAFALGAVTVFMVNIIFYDQRQGAAFSWAALSFAILGLILAWPAVKRFDFSYRVRRIFLIALTLLMTAGVGFALSRTNVNRYTEDFGPLRPAYTHRVRHGVGTPNSSDAGKRQDTVRSGQDHQQQQMKAGSSQNAQKNKP